MLQKYIKLIFIGIISTLFIMVFTSITSSIQLDISTTFTISSVILGIQLFITIYMDLRFILEVICKKLVILSSITVQNQYQSYRLLYDNKYIKKINRNSLCVSRC